ncbi:hypothetical protein [Tepidibacillus sp. HK-1]|uniref:hypothetical protein n=1 Tax=Tepidibacillus sp. HK-1 TaxID=1883407 RepID=UPI000852A1A4|nr:hypothetical protein [Tepidibacillus sp. HK-1]GBF10076.1 hypothetical protein HK1_00088 [Tepidibacillus sp. HK-1]
MGRLAQIMIIGGLVAAVTRMMRRSSKTERMMNQAMNMMINMMGRLGLFRLIGTSRIFRRMVRTR